MARRCTGDAQVMRRRGGELRVPGMHPTGTTGQVRRSLGRAPWRPPRRVAAVLNTRDKTGPITAPRWGICSPYIALNTPWRGHPSARRRWLRNGVAAKTAMPFRSRARPSMTDAHLHSFRTLLDEARGRMNRRPLPRSARACASRLIPLLRDLCWASPAAGRARELAGACTASTFSTLYACLTSRRRICP